MNKRIILLLWMLTFSITVSAKSMRLPIELLALESDVIAIGEIVSFTDSTYEFKVEDYIKGDADSIITVQLFHEWTCNRRYARVEKGQKIFLFLKIAKGQFEILNGSTGEIPIINNEIILNDYEENEHIDAQWHPYTMDLLQFKMGISGFIHCFKSVNCDECYTDTLFQLCDAKSIMSFKLANKFSGWLYERVEDEYKIYRMR